LPGRIYHACHRELCAHGVALPFAVVNILELVGEAMGVSRPDLFKQWKMMQDLYRVLADLGDRPEAAGLAPRGSARPHPRRATAAARPLVRGVAGARGRRARRTRPGGGVPSEPIGPTGSRADGKQGFPGLGLFVCHREPGDAWAAATACSSG
jgi:hypothetical protein